MIVLVNEPFDGTPRYCGSEGKQSISGVSPQFADRTATISFQHSFPRSRPFGIIHLEARFEYPFQEARRHPRHPRALCVFHFLGIRYRGPGRSA